MAGGGGVAKCLSQVYGLLLRKFSVHSRNPSDAPSTHLRRRFLLIYRLEILYGLPLKPSHPKIIFLNHIFHVLLNDNLRIILQNHNWNHVFYYFFEVLRPNFAQKLTLIFVHFFDCQRKAIYFWEVDENLACLNLFDYSICYLILHKSL